MAEITLAPLTAADREQFISDNQEAFNYGALEEFGRRDDHFEEEGEIISRQVIEASIDGGEAYRILADGQPVGGAVIRVEGDRGDLELLFVSPKVHSKGIGYAAWCAIEKLHPEVTVWETVTPYFEQRNIHFYVNRCGFHIVEFFNAHHPDPHDPEDGQELDDQFPAGMFRFEKRMQRSELSAAKANAISLRTALERIEGDLWSNERVCFRPLKTEADLIYATMECQLSKEQEDMVNPAWFSIGRAYLFREDNCPCIICTAQGQPVGFIDLSRWLGRGDAYSWSFYIDRDHQGKGYGKSAARLAIRLLKAADPAKPIKLATEQSNEKAQRLYASLGFRQLAELDGDDLVFGL